MSRINPLMISKTLLIFVIVNFVSESHGQTAERFFRKDYTYMGQFGSFYKIHTIPHTWADAKRVCALEGATLWHPEGRDESYKLLEFYKNRETSLNIGWIFTGLSDLLVEGVFETVDGMSFYQVYNNWESGQPDNHLGKQNCVRINLHTKLMDDEHCYLKYPFVCKKSILSLKWDQQCNMANLDYTYNKDSGKCYKLHKTPLKWTDAYAVCQAEQSSLAVIRNRSDADYLLNLTKSGADFVKPSRYVSYQRGIYHLGFHNRLTEGWQTVTGKLMTSDPDVWFDNHQPDDNDPDQCGSMIYTGLLINVNCDTRAFFICEHEIDG